MFDLIIIGGGPAGSAAGVYAARKRLKTLLLTDEWGGQSIVSPDIENWIGTKKISGEELAKSLREHVESYAGDILTTSSPARATKLETNESGVTVHTMDGKQYEARAALITTGAHRRKLAVPGAEEFDQKGLTYCASCDGPLFSGMDVAVIGGGNAGFESAAQLLAYAKSVTLLQRSDTLKADEVTQKKVLAHPNMTVLLNTEPTAVLGEKFVNGLAYKNNETGEEGTLNVSGIFVEIGLIPNTDWVDGVVAMNERKQIVVDPRTQRATLTAASSFARVWAAGDVTDSKYHQNNIAAGDAVRALEDIYVTLHAK